LAYNFVGRIIDLEPSSFDLIIGLLLNDQPITTTMKLSIATTTTSVLLLLLATAGGAQAKNEGKKPKTCKGKKCTIDTSGIDLGNDQVIELVDIGEQGKSIKCYKTNKGKKKGNGSSKIKKWHGLCEDGARDLLFVERNGKLTGSVHIDDEACIIHDGITECTLMENLPDEEHLDEEEDNGGRLLANEDTQFVFGFKPQEDKAGLRGSESSNRRRLYDDSGSNLDVMVVWTREAECRYNGLSYDENCDLTEESTEAFRGMIDLLVAQSNTAFAVSGIASEVRLVHAYRDDSYVETTSTNALFNIRDVDGYMDDVHAKRALYGADLVHFILGGTGCGVAFLGPLMENAFSVTRYTCAVDQYSFTHELAHSLGAHHE